MGNEQGAARPTAANLSINGDEDLEIEMAEVKEKHPGLFERLFSKKPEENNEEGVLVEYPVPIWLDEEELERITKGKVTLEQLNAIRKAICFFFTIEGEFASSGFLKRSEKSDEGDHLEESKELLLIYLVKHFKGNREGITSDHIRIVFWCEKMWNNEGIFLSEEDELSFFSSCRDSYLKAKAYMANEKRVKLMFGSRSHNAMKVIYKNTIVEET